MFLVCVSYTYVQTLFYRVYRKQGGTVGTVGTEPFRFTACDEQSDTFPHAIPGFRT